MNALMIGTGGYDPAQPLIIVPKCPKFSAKLSQMVTPDGKMCGAPRVYKVGEPRGTVKEVNQALRRKMAALAPAVGVAAAAPFKMVMVPKCPAGTTRVPLEEYQRYNRTAAKDTAILDPHGHVCITYKQALNDLTSGTLAPPQSKRSAAKLARDEMRVFAGKFKPPAVPLPVVVVPPVPGVAGAQN